MSSYPGENPYAEGSKHSEHSEDTDQVGHPDEGEPTAPITPSPQGMPYPGPATPPAAAQPPRPTAPYPHAPHQGYPSQPPGGWVPQPGYYPPAQPPPPPYATWSPVAPEHPQATTAMIVGILGLAVGFSLCGIGWIASPFAWALGHSALRDIQAAPGRYRGEAAARTGMYTGIAGTALLVLGLLALLVVALIAILGPSTTGSSI